MSKSLSVFLMLVASALLAGCADDPPSGEFTLSPGPLSTEGTVEIDYQDFEDPLDQASGPDDPLCTARPPELGLSCVPPHSSFSVMFPPNTLPAADPTAPYTAYFVGSEEIEIGALEGGEGNFSASATFDRYLGDQQGAQIVIRMGGVPIASAPATEGIQSFEANPALRGVSGTGSFDGRDFTVQVAGAPQNATLVGWFVMEGEDGVAEHVVSFPITSGENTYVADQDVADYDAFHIHLGGSKINLAMADLEA